MPWLLYLLTPWSRVLLEKLTSKPGCFTPRKDMVPTIQEAGWALGPFRKATENLAPSGIQSLDCPAHSDSLYQLC